jgi:hypothetical protein
MKGFNNCLSCGCGTNNKKYCSDKCKTKYYYHNKPEVRENKIKKSTMRRGNIFYVYGFYYKHNDKPFYIGKGSGGRYLSITGRSKAFNEVISNNEYYSKIIKDNLFENVAIKLESKLINTLEGLINIMDRADTPKRECTMCGRNDVNFYDFSSIRRCKSCTKELYEKKKRDKEKMVLQSALEFKSKGELSLINLYNLIYNK